MNIIGIETSCDETAAAVVADGVWVRSNVVASQVELHRSYGGVVPELAARGHVTAIIPVVHAALDEAGIGWDDLDAIAVTAGPGLAGALLVGVNVAKGMALARDLPLVAVNHLEAHVLANWLTPEVHVRPPETLPEAPSLPALCLLVSGGHTELIVIERPGVYHHVGRTLDDAAGEAFDKGARLLGLGYPGGPAIQQAAMGGHPDSFALPRAWLEGTADFSFSGLKTALLRLTEPYRLPSERPSEPDDAPFPQHRPARFRDDLPTDDLAAAFQDAVVDVLAVKTANAAYAHGARSVLLAGGVAANAALRERLVREIAARTAPGETPLPVRFPPLWFCTDNAAMVGGAGFSRWQTGKHAGWDLDIRPRWPLDAAS